MRKKTVYSTCAATAFLFVLGGASLITSGTALSNRSLIPAPILEIDPQATASTGEVRALVIVTDFADTSYESNRLSDETMQNYLFGSGKSDCYPCENLTDYFDRASYGALHMTGDVYHYTASGNIADYESSEYGYELLVQEVLSGLNDTIDYTQYDGNHDGYIDALCLSVPTGGNADFWYGCTATWYMTDLTDTDGMKLYHYVISDEQPYNDTMSYYLSTLTHEYGHCMGLPDYYRYKTIDGWQATTGAGGIERMDEAEGDFCSLSKLLLGWYSSSEIQTFNLEGKESQTFTLSDDSLSGSCLLLPKKSSDGYFSEYFLVDYLTPSANYDDLFTDGGVRIYHVDLDRAIDEWNTPYLKYDNFSPDYDSSGTGKRLIRLANENGDFYSAGATIDASVSGFHWYDESGKETVSSGYTISVDSISDGKCKLTVTLAK